MLRSLTEITRAKQNSVPRYISKYLDKQLTCKSIRENFLNYFVNDCNHNFVRSSPVVPFCDPSVAFVNAGMNQFKGILLGTQTPQYKKVANSQKCIRIGGKHNDLGVVGQDGYHHTFFEMLGNWSFGDYFKKEACEMAWNLLTKTYKINENVLYVTYFGGDEELELAPDYECRDIWKEIGVNEDRILPFGVEDNFWEMGPTGPCGPSTEIHADLLLNGNRSRFVNMGLPDLTELWNIVFIQYNRCPDGSIMPLPQKHIDTGMGLERLVALLQGKISNYDTDIFTNILSGITKSCKGIPSYKGKFGEQDWNQLDTNYRILADHTRMIIASLADNIIPEQNQKLRRVMRKAFQLSENVFKQEKGLLKEISNYVVENLGCVYPEMEKNIKQIHQVIDYEEDLYKSLRTTATSQWKTLVHDKPSLLNWDVIETPGLIAAYKDIKTQETLDEITSTHAFKLYDTYGLNEEIIAKLGKALDVPFDLTGFKQEMSKAKLRSRNVGEISRISQILQTYNCEKTDATLKYASEKVKGDYVFETLDVKIVKAFVGEVEVDCIEPGVKCNVMLDKTCLYYESGGQSADKGSLSFGNGVFDIDNVVHLNGYVLHEGVLKSRQMVPIKTNGTLKVNHTRRLSNMQNHTATHLLNAAIKKVKGVTTYQKSSQVNQDFLNLDVGVFGSKLGLADVGVIERVINDTINRGVDVRVLDVDSQGLLSLNDVTLLPGEVYPDLSIRLIEIVDGENLISREPCCGTHVQNTSDLHDFCIIGLDSVGRSTASIFAVTGERARLARENGEEIVKDINRVRSCKCAKEASRNVAEIRSRLNYKMSDSTILPITIKHDCLRLLKDLNKLVKNRSKDNLKEEITNVLHESCGSHQKYIVHNLLNTGPLHQATHLCQNVPVIVLSYSDNKVKARCCVPEHLKNENFDAKQWLSNTVCLILNSSYVILEDEDLTLICNMKSVRVNNSEWDALLIKSLEAAKRYAETHLR